MSNKKTSKHKKKQDDIDMGLELWKATREMGRNKRLIEAVEP